MSGRNGYIKLHRKMLDWGWYQNQNVKDLFIHLLLIANFKESQFEDMTIYPGQIITSINSLSRATGLSQKSVRNALDKLEKVGVLGKQTTNRFTLITIENWEYYQSEEFKEGKQRANEGQTKGIQRANEGQHHKNAKNAKNAKNDNNPPIVPPQRGQTENVKAGTAKATSKAKKEITIEELENLTQGFKGELYVKIHDFVAFRREMGKPMTLRAVKLFLKHLHELSEANGDKGIAIIEQSMRNGWQDIYQLKDRQREEKRKVSFADIV